MSYLTEVEEEKPIVGFPRYVITSFGRVINIQTGREMVLSPTLEGIVTVGLMYEGRQYRRSVKVLVARAFVPGETEIFDTPIQLDGDRWNLRADNIVWRPRWFAWKYARQFAEARVWHDMGPIMDVVHHIRYATVFDAVCETGVLAKDVVLGLNSEKRIFPTNARFIML